MKWIQIMIMAITAAMASGCDSGHVVIEKLPTTVATASGDYTIDYTFTPDPIPKNQHFSVQVVVTRKDGTDLPEDFTIQVDADMPAHGHGINTAPEIKKLPSGTYHVDGLLFHMGGQWELYIDVMEGGIPDRATIPIQM
jgi:hypothetical protein